MSISNSDSDIHGASSHSDIEKNIAEIRDAQREIENKIDRLTNAPLDESPLQWNIEEIW